MMVRVALFQSTNFIISHDHPCGTVVSTSSYTKIHGGGRKQHQLATNVKVLNNKNSQQPSLRLRTSKLLAPPPSVVPCHQYASSCSLSMLMGFTYGLQTPLVRTRTRSSNCFGVSSTLDFHSKVVVNESNEAYSVSDCVVYNRMPTLEEYGTNLTKLAEESILDPIAGWQQQIECVIRILDSHTKKNIWLVGESGVGKTAIVESLAQRIAIGDVPITIQGKKVIRLEMGLLVAGTKSHGEFEETLKKLMEEVKQNDNIILFIDGMHTLIGADEDSAISAAANNILKPALASGEIQYIGATTQDEFRKHIEKDSVLLGQSNLVKVPEATVDETIQILKALREEYEIRHMLCYTDESLVAAAELSYQYIRDQFLPDNAINLIDLAGSRIQLHNAQLLDESIELEKELEEITEQKYEAIHSQQWEKAGDLSDRETVLRNEITNLVNEDNELSKAIVTEIDIQHIVSSLIGIPVERLLNDEFQRRDKMEESLRTSVIGQDAAVEAISRAVCRERSGLKNPNRPIASFIFSGPATGVGKLKLAKALASYCFGSEEAMIHLNMSEFTESHHGPVYKLIGFPPGYIGGQLTEVVRRQPYTVLLFDNFELAHPDVSNLMLQILEYGRLTDSRGKTVDFKNTIVIMASKLGSNVMKDCLRFRGRSKDKYLADYYNSVNHVTELLKHYFRTEFLNQLDEVILFRQLDEKDVEEISNKLFKEVFNEVSVRLQQEKGIYLRAGKDFMGRVIREGYKKDSKWRAGLMMMRTLTRYLKEDVVAKKMLTGEIKEGDTVIVEHMFGDVVFECYDKDGVAGHVVFIFKSLLSFCFLVFFVLVFLFVMFFVLTAFK